MKKFYLYGVIVIISAILIMGFVFPKHATVSRSIVVNKPIGEVYTYMKSLKNMNDWSPWVKKDSNAKHEYFGIDGEIGSGHKWDSENKEVGAGSQKITELALNQRVKFQMNFIRPYEDSAVGGFNFDPSGEGTKVTWYIDLEYGFMERVVNGLFKVVDKFLGEEFEIGLAAAKELMEK